MGCGDEMPACDRISAANGAGVTGDGLERGDVAGTRLAHGHRFALTQDVAEPVIPSARADAPQLACRDSARS